MIKLIPVFADLQIHNYKPFAKGNDRLFNCLDVLDKVWAHADELGSPYVLFNGDLFDSQGSLPTVVVDETITKFKDLAKRYPNIRCIAITGNHDQATKNLLHAPAVSALRHLEKVVPGRFICIDDEVLELPGLDIVVFGIPYYEYAEHFREKLKLMAAEARSSEFKGKQKVLMIHQTPTGLGNPNIPFETDVNDELYDVFDMVFDGHIHMRKQITDKFLIVGSPIHRTMEDVGQEKGWIDMHTSDVTKWDFVSTKGLYPEFKKMRVRSAEDLPTNSKDYIIPDYEITKAELIEGDASSDDFGSNLDAATLVENYWKEVDGEDEELLKIGLKLVL